MTKIINLLDSVGNQLYFLMDELSDGYVPLAGLVCDDVFDITESDFETPPSHVTVLTALECLSFMKEYGYLEEK